MKIILYTQVLENYGAHDWDGRGECPQYWKFKGGNDIEVVRNLTPNEAADGTLLHQIVYEASKLVNKKTEYFEEYVRDWELVEDDHLTAFEKSQLEFDGAITYPRKKLVLAA
jgi:hypothetical protein